MLIKMMRIHNMDNKKESIKDEILIKLHERYQGILGIFHGLF